MAVLPENKNNSALIEAEKEKKNQKFSNRNNLLSSVSTCTLILDGESQIIVMIYFQFSKMSYCRH